MSLRVRLPEQRSKSPCIIAVSLRVLGFRQIDSELKPAYHGAIAFPKAISAVLMPTTKQLLVPRGCETSPKIEQTMHPPKKQLSASLSDMPYVLLLIGTTASENTSVRTPSAGFVGPSQSSEITMTSGIERDGPCDPSNVLNAKPRFGVTHTVTAGDHMCNFHRMSLQSA